MTERVPTVESLVSMGLAHPRVIPKIGTVYVVTAEGHALMGAAMKRNAQEARARGEGDRGAPPGRGNRWWTEPHQTEGKRDD